MSAPYKFAGCLTGTRRSAPSASDSDDELACVPKPRRRRVVVESSSSDSDEPIAKSVRKKKKLQGGSAANARSADAPKRAKAAATPRPTPAPAPRPTPAVDAMESSEDEDDEKPATVASTMSSLTAPSRRASAADACDAIIDELLDEAPPAPAPTGPPPAARQAPAAAAAAKPPPPPTEPADPPPQQPGGFKATRRSRCPCGEWVEIGELLGRTPKGAWGHARCAARLSAEAAANVAKIPDLTSDQRAVAEWRPASWASAARGRRVRVIAHAGTGKTTTLTALARGLSASSAKGGDPWLRIAYWTFSKASAEDAGARFGPRTGRCGVDARTMHSALLAYVQRGEARDGRRRLECPPRLPQTMEDVAALLDPELDAVAKCRLDAVRSRKRGDTARDWGLKLRADRRDLAAKAWRVAVEYCRSADDDVLGRHVPDDVQRADADFCGRYGPQCGALRPFLARWAKKLWAAASDPDRSDLACTQEVMAKKALLRLRARPDETMAWGGGSAAAPPHVLFVDEAQDLDDCALAIIECQRSRGPTTCVLVGDPAQAIYLFRGASDKSLRDTKVSGHADEAFELRRSFRFGPAIAREANRMLSVKAHYDRTFRFEPVVGCGPPDGAVARWEESGLPAPPFAFICRSNKGIVDAAAKVVGLVPPLAGEAAGDAPAPRDVRLDFGADGGAQGVLAYLQVVDDVFALFANAARRPGAPPAVAKWRSFADLLRAAEEEDAAGARGSLVDVNVRGAADAVQKWRERTPRLTASLRGANAARAAPTVTFATSHKTKGLEFDTVVVGDDFAALVDDHGAPSKFVKKEEIHAWHVALTRAKRALYVPPKFAALQDLHARTRKVVPGAPPPPPPGPAQVGLLAVVQAPPGPAPVSIGAMMLAKKAPAARKRHPGW